jgi:hypothetical protein
MTLRKLLLGTAIAFAMFSPALAVGNQKFWNAAADYWLEYALHYDGICLGGFGLYQGFSQPPRLASVLPHVNKEVLEQLAKAKNRPDSEHNRRQFDYDMRKKMFEVSESQWCAEALGVLQRDEEGLTKDPKYLVRQPDGSIEEEEGGSIEK